MKNKKNKILVLSDMKETTESILKSTISLSKIINADIELFHVKKPTDIVVRENQLSAMRTINQEYFLIDNQLQNQLNTFAKDYNIKIKHNFTFGNVKSEINKRIKECKPDVIVLGKKKSKQLSFVGDKVTDFVLKNYEGAVMIASSDGLEPNNELSLGVLNNTGQLEDIQFAENLLSQTSKPLKSFKIIEKADNSEVKPVVLNQKTIEYTFDKGDNTINNLSKYLTRTNVNLLCLDRGEKLAKNKLSALSPDIKKVINNVNVSLFISKRKQPISA